MPGWSTSRLTTIKALRKELRFRGIDMDNLWKSLEYSAAVIPGPSTNAYVILGPLGAQCLAGQPGACQSTCPDRSNSSRSSRVDCCLRSQSPRCIHLRPMFFAATTRRLAGTKTTSMPTSRGPPMVSKSLLYVGRTSSGRLNSSPRLQRAQRAALWYL